MNDLCASPNGSEAERGRILAWLGEGAREVSWALCSLARERWAALPPDRLGTWPALRHVRHLVLHERHVALPAVVYALDGATAESGSTVAYEQADAAWDPVLVGGSAEALLSDLGALRFELAQRLEMAPDAVWAQSHPHVHAADAPPRLAELVLRMRQHELEHLATIWRIALFWDRVSPSTERHAPAGAAGLFLHPADRLEESH